MARFRVAREILAALASAPPPGASVDQAQPERGA